MRPDLLPLAIGIPLGLLAAYAGVRLLVRYGAKPRWPKEPIPPHWWRIVERHLPIARALGAEERERLLRYMQLFLSRIRFEGCRGVAVTDEMRVAIAAQACLLIVNSGGPCYPRVSTVLVYPGTFVGQRFSWLPTGEGIADPDALQGEAWRDGVVVVGWEHADRVDAGQADGENVVLHEFAHQLDFEDGAADGVPVLDGRVSYQAWAATMEREYDKLRAAIEAHASVGALRDYGATNEAEFFAVATESFFERPRDLAAGHPELYQQLSRYYRLDPARMVPDAGHRDHLPESPPAA